MEEFFRRFELIPYENIKKIKLSATAEEIGEPCVGGKDGFIFQTIINNQAFHENVARGKLAEFLLCKMEKGRVNITVICKEHLYFFKLSKKGKLLFSKERAAEKENPEKKFELPLDIPVLKHLGLVSAEGTAITSMRHKLEQITRFCAIASDAAGKRKKINIIDCGCGKAYLSFVLYHYLKYHEGIDIVMHGVDLKESVISDLKKLAEGFGYDKLTFSAGDIKQTDLSPFDMLISLHACDKATDYALFNAVRANVPVILCAPCCQHEINEALSSERLKLFSRYGLIKERVSALLTDAVRASLLTAAGYKVKVMEFVDFEHSPKNIIIKAEKGNVTAQTRSAAFDEAKAVLEEFNTTQELFTLLAPQLRENGFGA